MSLYSMHHAPPFVTSLTAFNIFTSFVRFKEFGNFSNSSLLSNSSHFFASFCILPSDLLRINISSNIPNSVKENLEVLGVETKLEHSGMQQNLLTVVVALMLHNQYHAAIAKEGFWERKIPKTSILFCDELMVYESEIFH